MSQVPARLGQILLAQQSITAKQLASALDYQAQHGQPIGHCLLTLGYIEEKVLNRALRRQTWLKPCAACLTCLCAPFTFSTCYADEGLEADLHVDWIEQHDPYSYWSERTHLSSNEQTGMDFIKMAAEAAWGIYQGEPEAGEWQYSLTEQTAGYSVSVTMNF
jgi:hypothetical protein